MSQTILYTQSGGRLTQWHKPVRPPRYQLVLIPGGAGMGSEYLEPLVTLLQGPDSIWTIDLPGNGNNPARPDTDYSQWRAVLPEVFHHLDHVIFLGHSFGGMLILSEPAIEKKAKALILIGALPETIFKKPAVKKASARYARNPSDKAGRALLIELAPLCFKPQHVQQAIEIFSRMPFSHQAYEALGRFLKTYRAQYIPRIPTLILSGDEDVVTPIEHFENHPEFGKLPFVIAKIKNANHYPWIDNAESTQQAIVEFLNSLE
jgi:pimeloyl-ACP methyl ester carboxylesterase